MKRLLNFQADRIELVLASHKVPARVTGGTVTPRFVRFQIMTPLGVKVRQVAGLAEELALSLNAPNCRVYRQEGQVQVEVPGPRAAPSACSTSAADSPPSARRACRPSPPCLGLDEEGAPLLLRLPSPDVAHVLIAGTTGSGKTALARSMVASLALLNPQRALQLVLIDPKGRGLSPFAGLPHLLVPVVTEVDEAVGMLRRLVAEMERRDAQGRSEPRLVVVIDELADLLLVGGKADGRGAHPPHPARPRGRHPPRGQHPKAHRRAHGRPDQVQLPGPPRRQCRLRRGCPRGQRPGRHRR